MREILEVRDALIQRAHQHGQPQLALALQRDVRGSNFAMERAVDAVRRLEALGTPRPALQHAVDLWFAPVLAKRLRAARLASVGELVNCCNARGRGWWRRIARVGALAARAIVSWRLSHENTLGVALGAHVTGGPAALALPGALQRVGNSLAAMRRPELMFIASSAWDQVHCCPNNCLAIMQLPIGFARTLALRLVNSLVEIEAIAAKVTK